MMIMIRYFNQVNLKLMILDRSKSSHELDSSGSQKMIESNLPDGVNRDIEAWLLQ